MTALSFFTSTMSLKVRAIEVFEVTDEVVR
jgi:hypothetical protein